MSKPIVILNKAAIKNIEQKAYKCLGETAKVLQDEIREAGVIPRMDNHLAGEKFIVDTSTEGKGYVRMRFEGPYARRLYFHPEYNFHKSPWTGPDGRSHDGNPNAQGEWLKPWLKGGKYQKRPREIFAALLKGQL